MYCHDFELEIDGRTLRFIFEDINLPHSDADEEGSHGFINFFIQQNPDLANGTQILNDAAIFFDFNEPVITNNHLYTINDGLVHTTNLNQFDFEVQPNPTKGLVQIQRGSTFSGKDVFVKILNLNGQTLVEQKMIGDRVELDLSHLNRGMYFVQLQNEDGDKGVQKIILQ